MKPPRPRLVVRLRLTLLGIEPAIWREIIIDRSASLHELHEAIQLAFDGDLSDHHLFRGAAAGEEIPEERWPAEVDWPFIDPYRLGVVLRTPPSARWGDRWTMIDLRDPTVEEESSVTVGHVVRAATALFYSWQARSLWSCRIDAYEDDVLEGHSPRVTLHGGVNRAPMSSCPDAATYDAWLRILEEPEHVDHLALKRMLDRSVGPWMTFDPEDFDVDGARARFEEHVTGRRGSSSRHDYWSQPPLDDLVGQLPASNQPGLRRHIQRSAVRMPAVITRDDAADLVRPYQWLVTAADRGGIALTDGAVPDTVLRAAAENLACDLTAIPSLVASAKQLGLLYLRRGRLHAPLAATDARADPLRLWHLMATQLLRRRMPGADELTNTLFMLTVADGSLGGADADAGTSRIVSALELIGSDPGWPGADDRWRQWTLNLSVSRDDEFDRATPYERWRSEHSAALASSEESATTEDSERSRVLTALEPLIRTLAPLGLARSGSGKWVVPDALREFARAALA